jgi:hypothetical protein
MFDWDDLRYFLAVARHHSTLAAGRALKVNQSSAGSWNSNGVSDVRSQSATPPATV